jgi:hypothetical protein
MPGMPKTPKLGSVKAPKVQAPKMNRPTNVSPIKAPKMSGLGKIKPLTSSNAASVTGKPRYKSSVKKPI